jgi:hypothetical protein
VGVADWSTARSQKHKNCRQHKDFVSLFSGVRLRYPGECSASDAFDVSTPWIPERSATGLREADLNVLSKLGNQGLEWRLEPEAFTGREVRREDDLLDFLVGCAVDIQVARP